MSVNNDRMLNDMSSENTSLLRSAREVSSYSGSLGSSNLSNARQRIKPGRLQTVFSKYESLDYEVPENELYIEEYRASTSSQHIYIGMSRWIVMFLVGIMTALVAVFIDICIEQLSTLKYNYIYQYFTKYIDEREKIIIPFFLWIAIDVLMVGFASFLVSYFEPVAAGSGIPVIKCFLNGVKIPHVVRLKTLVVKVVGVIFSVAGGLAVGKEGPMIHSGAVLAAGISQGRSVLFRKDFKLFETFRTDHEKRDFVSGGAAAGVSAAFGAPVGGVLFSLEEGASFWNQSLTWRIFFSSVISTFSLNLLLSIYHDHSGELSYPGLINFGSFSDIKYSVREIPFLLIMGIIGGFLGALFNFINQKLTVFRMRYIRSAWKRVLEAMLISALTTCALFHLMYNFDVCQSKGVSNVTMPFQFFCKDGEFSVMGTLVFRLPEQSIKNLFHTSEVYDLQILAVFFPVYFLLATWTYGSFVPSGLFVPCILTGAAWGRLFALGLSKFLPEPFVADTCLYAVVGSAAFLGGVVRMTISLTVILMEATRNITYGLPMMLVIMVAKWIGDLFNEGLYDIHIRLSRVPILGWDPPQMVEGLNARNIMNKPVCCMNLIENVGNVIELLKTTTYNGFPVIDPISEDEETSDKKFGTYRGLILRSQLIVLLKHKVFFQRGKRPTKHQLTMKDFRDAYPRFQPVRTIRISPLERECSLDLQPFMNVMPYTVHEESSISRVFHLFRAIGLRHLVVVDHHNQVVGIVTRKDLARYRQWSHLGKTRLEKIHVLDDSASEDE